VSREHWEGQVVDGQFHLRRFLGGSQASAVFLTEYGDGAAAIKLVPADAGDASAQLSRWELARTLSHPHLIRLFQTGRCRVEGADFLYVVMEYAQEELSQVLAGRPLSSDEAGELLGPALDALGYLHGKGLAHGRLKPANFLAVDDRLKLSVDGVCRAGEPSGMPAPSDPHDPPEIRIQWATPAGDVWSFAATLVEALTRRLPVGEGSQQPLPAPFSQIARHCLQRDPERRWAVTDILAHLRGPAAGTGDGPASRYRWALPAVAAVLVLAAILVLPRLLNQPEEAPPPVPVPAEAPPVRSVRPSPTGVPAPPRNVVQQVLPDVPQAARDTIQGAVRLSVRVAVDPAGNVVNAVLESPGPSRYFAGLALEAARKWKFTPAAGDTEPVEWILRFEIQRETTNVLPERAGR